MGFNFKLGLKLHSTNVGLIPEVLGLKKEGLFDYIELYIIPGTYDEAIGAWNNIDVSYVIHAPHSFNGVNLAQADKWETNQYYFNEARQFADDLSSDIIIVHGGNNGTIEETIRQISLLNDKRIVLENKPQKGLFGEICVGWSPLEFQRGIAAGALYGTVLDFVHAVCAANSEKIDEMKIIKALSEFHPRIFHLSDGDTSSEKDVHLNLGKGNLNIESFLSFIPNGGLVTIETPRDPLKGLSEFIYDIKTLETILSK